LEDEMPANLTTLMVYVRDMSRAVSFYRQGLGAAPTIESPYWSQFELGSGVILGLHPAREGGAAPAGGWTPGFHVEDLRSWRQTVLAAGGTVAMEYHDVPGGVILEVADPDGNLIDAMQEGVTCADFGVASAG
jgi:predicted enzyme related to lactoylglutathione lyase